MSHDFPQFITGGQGLFTTHTKSNPPAACHHRRPNISKKPSDLPIFAIVLTVDLVEIGALLQSQTFVLQWHTNFRRNVIKRIDKSYIILEEIFE